MWKEAAVAYFKILSWHLPAGTEEIDEKHSGVPAEIRATQLPNTSQKCYRLSQLGPHFLLNSVPGLSKRKGAPVVPSVFLSRQLSSYLRFSFCFR
jgi:hypothetical protein